MKLHAIAIDDEPIALEIIQQHAKKISFLDLKFCFLSQSEGLVYIEKKQPDLIFLDIQMPDGSGIDLAKVLQSTTQIIFTTAFSDYAVQAFDMAVTDYLLKPISAERFECACNRALENHETINKHKYFFVKSGYEQVRLNLDDLMYIKAADNYVVFYETNRQTISRVTLTEIAARLPQQNFCRVHKSYIISIDKVERLTNHKVTLSGIEIPLTMAYRKELLKWL